MKKSTFAINGTLVAVLALCLFLSLPGFSQTMTRQDKLFIQKGIQFQSWMRNDQTHENTIAPVRQGLAINRSGRYIRVQLPTTEPLALAEVQVFSGGVNVALNDATQQSSTNGSAVSNRAVDGNTDGDYANSSVSHTGNYTEVEAWWQVDLGASVAIDSIVLWNRTDCCGYRLKGFYCFVSDNPYPANTLLATIPQAGVSNYTQAFGNSTRYPTAAELNYAKIIPTYFETPGYNYTVHQQDPTMQWAIAKGGKTPIPDNVFGRNPSSFEISNGFLNSIQTANADNLSSICIGDEENYSVATQTTITNWFNIVKAKYPNALVHNNQYFGQWNASQMSTYMQAAQPDMLTFDLYYFHALGPTPGAGNTYTRLYQDMQTYRNYALGGWNGTGAAPIAFGGYLQFYAGDNPSFPGYYVAESEFNLNAFAYLTMGAKWINEWLYRAMTWNNTLQQLTPQYYQVANIGKQVVNLSPHLSRLRTTDVRFIPGQNTGGTNVSPNNISAWNSAAGSYITNIVATNLGTYNNGLRGDVLVGYFKPVPGLDSTGGITMAPVPAMTTKYLMLMNGLSSPNGCCGNPVSDTLQGKANLTKQKITLSIDFGISPVDTLYRVRRSDGVVEMVALTPLGGTQYTVSDTLDGGLADLFYWKNAGTTIPSGDNSVTFSSGSISGGNVTTLNGVSKFTIESWVKFNSIGNWHTLFGKSTDVNNRLLLQTHSDKSLYVNVSNGTNKYGQTAINTINTGQWYHIAVVYDGTKSTNAQKLKLYIDGVQKTLSFSGTIPTTTSSSNSAPLVVGTACTSCPSNSLNGTMDEVRVWNAALSLATLTAWKDKALGTCHPNSASLKLYWQLNSASNPAVATASLGTAYTGTIANATYVAGGQAAGASGCAGARSVNTPKVDPADINAEPDFVRIYPNPVSDGLLYLDIQSEEANKAVITVFDATGRQVHVISKHMGSNGLNKMSIDLSKQSTGLYIIEVKSKKQTRRYKFIKQ